MTFQRPSLLEQMRHDRDEIDRLCACILKGDRDQHTFQNGERVARTATEALDVLMLAHYYPYRPTEEVILDLWAHPPAAFLAEGDLPAEDKCERVRLKLKMVKDSDPGEGVDPLLRLAVVMGGTERVCVVDHNNDYVLWMRSEPPGKVRPDVALYLEATGKWQYMSRYDIRKDIARLGARYDRLSRLHREDGDRMCTDAERAFLPHEDTLP